MSTVTFGFLDRLDSLPEDVDLTLHGRDSVLSGHVSISPLEDDVTEDIPSREEFFDGMHDYGAIFFLDPTALEVQENGTLLAH
jgi:hypothetical protein